MYHRRVRVPDTSYRDIADLRQYSQEADESRRSSRGRFCVAATIEIVCQP
jgi:hypothetical protein